MENKVKILIAEDDAILREIIMGKLTSAGYEALGAEDGAKALELTLSQKPEIILLDILLPVKDGLEVLASIRNDASVSNTKVIAISNSDDPEMIKKIKSLGVQDFFIKAVFDSSDVVQKVNQIMRDKTNINTNSNPKIMNTDISNTTMGVSTNKKILIVEDDKFLREIASQKFEAEGYKIESVQTGDDAIKYLAENARPDLIVLDLILPGMSGFEVLEKVKANPVLKDIPVLILSNLGQEEDIEKAKKLGARDYLVKAHFSFAEIIKKIKEIIG